jgi:glycine/D-amino acid oxidase-like deaminating enzyme
VGGSPEIDYLVIGEGVVSLSTAHYIKKNSPKSRVVVVDKNPDPGMGDTSRSAAMFRVFFSSRVNVMITKSSVEFYKHVERSLGRNLGIRYLGYLFLVDVEELERMRQL